jgi:hypothetical protein
VSGCDGGTHQLGEKIVKTFTYAEDAVNPHGGSIFFDPLFNHGLVLMQ